MKTTHIHLHRSIKDGETTNYKGHTIVQEGTTWGPDGEKRVPQYIISGPSIKGRMSGFNSLEAAKARIDNGTVRDSWYIYKGPKPQLGPFKTEQEAGNTLRQLPRSQQVGMRVAEQTTSQDAELGGMKISQASNGKFEVSNIPASLKYGSSLGNFASEQAAHTWIENVVKAAEAKKEWKVEERDDPKSLWEMVERGLTEQEAKDIAMEIQQEGGVRWQCARAVKGT